MKNSAKLCGQLLLIALGFGLPTLNAFGLVDNPYRPIVDRNIFALKPPTPVTNTTAQPPSPPAGIELRGISTLLGRPQVFLNIKVAKPPEPPKDRSFVLDIGQREGEVEVLEINPAGGSVRLRNQGTELVMNLKDNATKPQAAAVAPVAAPLPVPGAPAVIGRPAIPSPNTGGTGSPVLPSASTGNSSPTLPTRSLRTGNQTSQVGGGFNDPVEQAAAIEVMAEANKAKIQAGQMPPPLKPA